MSRRALPDADYVRALAESPTVSAAAASLGVASSATIYGRAKRSPAIEAALAKRLPHRKGHGWGQRHPEERVLAVLGESMTLLDAARALGYTTHYALVQRAKRSPAVAEAFAQMRTRKAVVAVAKRVERRLDVISKAEAAAERQQAIARLTREWENVASWRDTPDFANLRRFWLEKARGEVRQTDIAVIMGVSRQRAQQLESSLGLRRRRPRP